MYKPLIINTLYNSMCPMCLCVSKKIQLVFHSLLYDLIFAKISFQKRVWLLKALPFFIEIIRIIVAILNVEFSMIYKFIIPNSSFIIPLSIFTT
jgi:hypothetical protein